MVTAMLPLLMACTSSAPQKSEAAGLRPTKILETKWECEDCSPEESKVVAYLQTPSVNITDKNAIATILGNIRQESNFTANICEGGARVSYHDCHRGGYGIIQWTSVNRYVNLGKFATKFECDPSTFDCQLRYMVNENIFQRQLPYFQSNGQSISYYMAPAYRWLGWGIKGYREDYAWDYLNKLRLDA
tara:strand:- start:2219 stop:2782 length:564 start_codon:yes stop_codon:yes gene_type:complete